MSETELGEDVGVVRLEPVPEAAARQAAIGGPRSAQEHEVALVEEIRRIAAVAFHGAEPWEGAEGCRGPLPSVADQLVNAERARTQWIRADGRRAQALHPQVRV